MLFRVGKHETERGKFDMLFTRTALLCSTGYPPDFSTCYGYSFKDKTRNFFLASTDFFDETGVFRIWISPESCHQEIKAGMEHSAITENSG